MSKSRKAEKVSEFEKISLLGYLNLSGPSSTPVLKSKYNSPRLQNTIQTTLPSKRRIFRPRLRVLRVQGTVRLGGTLPRSDTSSSTVAGSESSPSKATCTTAAVKACDFTRLLLQYASSRSEGANHEQACSKSCRREEEQRVLLTHKFSPSNRFKICTLANGNRGKEAFHARVRAEGRLRVREENNLFD